MNSDFLSSSRTRSLTLILFIIIFAGSSAAILLVIMIYREGVLDALYYSIPVLHAPWWLASCLLSDVTLHSVPHVLWLV